MKLMSAIFQVIREMYNELLDAARARVRANAQRAHQQKVAFEQNLAREAEKNKCPHTRDDGTTTLVKTSFSPTRGVISEFAVCQRCQFVTHDLAMVDKAPDYFQFDPPAYSASEAAVRRTTAELSLAELRELAGGYQK